MSIEEDKIAKFVQRLWDNPSLAGLSPLQKEEQLHLFVDANAAILQPTMASAAFFPGLTWFQVKDLLERSISQLANNSLGALYEVIMEKRMDLSFVYTLNKNAVEQRKLKEQISQYAKKLADKPESRKELTGPLLGIATGMVDKYVQQSLQRPKYISIELKKVQRLSIKPQNIADFVKMTMLLRPSVHYFAPAHNKIRHITSAYSDLVTQEMMKALNSIPRPLAKSGVNSFFSFQENPQMEATSRLAAIFSHRCRNLKSGIKAERGAESSDKSWFSVARKNYRYHGFDLDMLYELQNIASDNGW